MPEELIVRHCAPTLAGMKTGSMFSCPCDSECALRADIRDLNRRLGPKGMRMLLLRCRNRRAVVYLYRPGSLAQDLECSEARRLLAAQGYPDADAGRCVIRLIGRLRENRMFPHEVGLFLGYPPEDVCGFMERGARASKCVGMWRVYGDAEHARRIFAKYNKCTRVYMEQWAKGKSVDRLAVRRLTYETTGKAD